MDGDARTVGAGLRQIRQARHKSLRVVAGLAGISAGHLSTSRWPTRYRSPLRN